MKNKSTLKILLADDDVMDRELFIDAIQETETNCKIDEATNGKEVLEYLDRCKQFPDFIFLDLNMPIMDGRETLIQIKQSERLKVIPVFILTTSCSPNDVFDSYQAGANLFLVKQPSFDSLVSTLGNITALYHGGMATVEVY